MSERFRVTLNKLVRDGVAQDMKVKGQAPEITSLSDQDYSDELARKLVEEAKELGDAPGDSKELGQLMSVLRAYGDHWGFSAEQMLQLADECDSQKGAFESRSFISSITLDSDDPWLNYYSQDPERFIIEEKEH